MSKLAGDRYRYLVSFGDGVTAADAERIAEALSQVESCVLVELLTIGPDRVVEATSRPGSDEVVREVTADEMAGLRDHFNLR